LQESLLWLSLTKSANLDAKSLNPASDEVGLPSPANHSFLREDGYVRPYVRENGNVGRERKCDIRVKDAYALFVFLASLKYCGQWNIVAGVFKIKPTNFQKVVLPFAKVVYSFRYDKLVSLVADKLTMEALVLKGKRFASIRALATQQIGKMKESGAHYIAKQHLHGYKAGVFVLPNDWQSIVPHANPVSKSFEVFCSNVLFHAQHHIKSEENMYLADSSPYYREHILKRMGEQSETNDHIAHDRVISVLSDKYRWDEVNWDVFFSGDRLLKTPADLFFSFVVKMVINAKTSPCDFRLSDMTTELKGLMFKNAKLRSTNYDCTACLVCI
ncbi:hypothetical protein GN958_ATG21354, partial [Phytophthora infestans]